jgi:hypothetical protein
MKPNYEKLLELANERNDEQEKENDELRSRLKFYRVSLFIFFVTIVLLLILK